jgi:hypothetical protein
MTKRTVTRTRSGKRNIFETLNSPQERCHHHHHLGTNLVAKTFPWREASTTTSFLVREHHFHRVSSSSFVMNKHNSPAKEMEKFRLEIHISAA